MPFLFYFIDAYLAAEYFQFGGSISSFCYRKSAAAGNSDGWGVSGHFYNGLTKPEAWPGIIDKISQQAISIEKF